MKGLIIANGYGLADGIKNQIERLKEEFQKRNVLIDLKKNNEILVYIEKGNIKCNLGHYDFVVYLDKDRFVARMLEKCGYRLFNSSNAIELCDDKMLTHISLSNNGIQMPTSISSTLCYRDNGDRTIVDKVLKILNFPLIVKENYGSLGKQVYLINNKEDLLNIENKLIHTPHIFQEFISTSKGKDYRIIVIGHKVVAYMKRENKNSYLSNIACGGTALLCELPNEYLEVAIKVSRILNLDYCGVDILEGSNNQPIISEVNSNAFYEGIEKVTGVNVAGYYVDYILETIRKNAQ
ncbi:MAG TPA: RimK family alpha-L-glutamate ligase [Firmicutes bacterium]|nr:RimK family alpha-L-glutamate ligase [Bacillota bacterium]